VADIQTKYQPNSLRTRQNGRPIDCSNPSTARFSRIVRLRAETLLEPTFVEFRIAPRPRWPVRMSRATANRDPRASHAVETANHDGGATKMNFAEAQEPTTKSGGSLGSRRSVGGCGDAQPTLFGRNKVGCGGWKPTLFPVCRTRPRTSGLLKDASARSPITRSAICRSCQSLRYRGKAEPMSSKGSRLDPNTQIQVQTSAPIDA
jgi:hypothetical protein